MVAAQQSDNYDLSWNVIGGGAGNSESTNFANDGTIAQPVVDESQSENYQVQPGFWPGVFSRVASPTPTPTPTATPTATPSPTPKPVIEVTLFEGWNFDFWRQDECVPTRQATQNLIDDGVLNLAARFPTRRMPLTRSRSTATATSP
jgi:hypothetical protein